MYMDYSIIIVLAVCAGGGGGGEGVRRGLELHFILILPLSTFLTPTFPHGEISTYMNSCVA